MTSLPSVQRVLLTGGSGFIGRRLVTRLSQRGVEVSVIRNPAGSGGQPMAGAVGTHSVDVRDEGGLVRVFQEVRPDAVVHLATVNSIPICETNRVFALQVNIVGTESVLAAAEAAGVGVAVIASSGAVYRPSDHPLVEDESPLEAIDNYGLTKLTNEQQASFWATRTGGIARIARMYNAIGHDDPKAHLIPDILAQIPEGAREAEVRLGNTEPRRDYTHADDSAGGLEALLFNGDVLAPCEAFNICTGVEHSVLDVANMIGRHLGAHIHVVHDATRVRAVDRMHQIGSTTKTRERLGWEARFSFEEGIRMVLEGLGRLPPTAG